MRGSICVHLLAHMPMCLGMYVCVHWEARGWRLLPALCARVTDAQDHPWLLRGCWELELMTMWWVLHLPSYLSSSFSWFLQNSCLVDSFKYLHCYSSRKAYFTTFFGFQTNYELLFFTELQVDTSCALNSVESFCFAFNSHKISESPYNPERKRNIKL